MLRGIGQKPAAVFTVIYILAALVRLAIGFAVHAPKFDLAHQPEALNIARTLADTGSFANPFPTPTGYTAHSPPLYPAFVAGIYKVWGDTPRGEAVRRVTSVAAAALQYALLPCVSRALGLGLWPGILAGAGGALAPLHYHYEVEGSFETTWIAVFLELSTILFGRFLAASSWTLRSALFGGAWWACGCLISPNVLPVLIGFLAVGLWKLRPRAPRAAASLAAFAAAFLLVLAPWTIRNYLRLGGWFFVRDNFGLELYVSNYDAASPFMWKNILSPHWAEMHPHAGPPVARELASMGEVNFYRLKQRQALDWIRAHPAQFRSLTLRRIRAFWFPPLTRRWKAVFLWALTAAAFFAFLPLARENLFAALTLAAILLTFSPVYAVVSSTSRYQHPIYWVLLLLDGYLACFLLARFVPALKASES